jgi:putative hemolysin
MLSELLIIFALTLVNGLFSMSEISILSSRRARLEGSARRGNVAAQRALDLLASPNRFLSSVQIGITLVGIMLGMFSGESVVNNIKSFVENLPIPALHPYAKSIGTTINLLFIGFISLIFGELVPKRIGMSKPETIAKIVAFPMTLVSRVTAPFIWLLSKTTEIIMRVLNIKADESKVTEEEIKAMIDEGASAGAIDAVEQDIVGRVFHLGDKKVGALMTNRSSIIWLDVNDSEAELLTQINGAMHAIFPVCDESLDNVLGVVTLKDILSVKLKNQALDIRKILKPTNYLPENMSAYSTLEKFKRTKVHHSLVVDEYGTTIGIVTMSDVLEALVGHIGENSDIAYEIVQREDGSWLLDGQFPWDDFINEFDLDDDTHIHEGFHTIAGFLLYELKDLPKAGTKVKWRDLEFEVVDMDGARIDKIIISKK